MVAKSSKLDSNEVLHNGLPFSRRERAGEENFKKQRSRARSGRLQRLVRRQFATLSLCFRP
jgi:hypothetical protein